MGQHILLGDLSAGPAAGDPGQVDPFFGGDPLGDRGRPDFCLGGLWCRAGCLPCFADIADHGADRRQFPRTVVDFEQDT